jgi:hypothetical protein
MENNKLNKIRHFKGSLQDFIDYWEQDRGIETNPYKNVDYEYPVKNKVKDETLPYQTFNNTTFRKFKQD